MLLWPRRIEDEASVSAEMIGSPERWGREFSNSFLRSGRKCGKFKEPLSGDCFCKELGSMLAGALIGWLSGEVLAPPLRSLLSDFALLVPVIGVRYVCPPMVSTLGVKEPLDLLLRLEICVGMKFEGIGELPSSDDFDAAGVEREVWWRF